MRTGHYRNRERAEAQAKLLSAGVPFEVTELVLRDAAKLARLSAQARALQVGDVYRMPHEGPQAPLWRVQRVTPCAAYVQELWARPRTITLVGRDGKERTFTATQGSAVVAVSLHSAVELVS